MPSAKCSKSVPFDQSFKNVRNDYHYTASQVEPTSASAAQGGQVGMKRQGIDLLVMPCLLNDKLSPWAVRSVGRSAVR